MQKEIENLVENFLQTAKKPVIVIIGPTCSGKTGLAVQIAKKINGEIISADSRQIFRELNLGTAKATQAEMQSIPHYGIDLCNPEEAFSVAQFKTYALEKIQQILQNKKIPVLAGGTGLYVNAVTQGFTIPQVPADWELRAQLEKLETKELYQKLQEIDPKEAEKIHPNNRRYVIRAIEIAKVVGKKKSEIMYKKPEDLDILILGIKVEREVLYNRINQRVEQMLKDGLLEEVKFLIKQGYDFKKQAFNSVGYPECKAFLDGKLTYAEMLALIQKNTRNYAKRQLTWWRGDDRVNWLGE